MSKIVEIPARIEQRVRERIYHAPANAVMPGDCHLWMGVRKNNGYGIYYGVIGWRDAGRYVQRYAHRLSYLIHRGPIPDGLDIDHLCRTPACVNPDHLEAVTRRENVLRGDTITARNAAKTDCPQGHAYDGPNTHHRASGRSCRACGRARRRAYVARYPDRVRESKRRSA